MTQNSRSQSVIGTVMFFGKGCGAGLFGWTIMTHTDTEGSDLLTPDPQSHSFSTPEKLSPSTPSPTAMKVEAPESSIHRGTFRITSHFPSCSAPCCGTHHSFLSRFLHNPYLLPRCMDRVEYYLSKEQIIDWLWLAFPKCQQHTAMFGIPRCQPSNPP